MSDVIPGIVGVLLGIAATYAVARYYFKRTVDKKLTPYIRSASPVFHGIDPEVRKDIEIKYNGKTVSDIFELDFVVVNEGSRAIRDVIEPMTVRFPGTTQILDSKVISTNPRGRRVDISEEETPEGPKVTIDFKLLNSGENFNVKVLLQGVARLSEIKFLITSDDLPPVLEVQKVSYGPPRAEMSKKDYLGFSTFFLAVGLAGVFGIWRTSFLDPTPFPFSVDPAAMDWTVVVTVLWILLILVHLVLGVGVLILMTTESRKPNFGLPRRFKYLSPFLDDSVQDDHPAV